MAHQTSVSPAASFTSASSASLVLYNPNLLQNRAILPLPVGWTTSSKSLTSFTLFSELPPELRIMIWEDALPGPRIITMKHFYAHPDDEAAVSQLNRAQKTPALLHTCKEAREVALKVYEKLSIHSIPRDDSPRRVSYLYADLSIDTLLFSNVGYHDYDELHLKMFDMKDFKNVVHFAFADMAPRLDIFWKKIIARLLKGKAETFTLVRWKDRRYREQFDRLGQVMYLGCELARLAGWQRITREIIEKRMEAGDAEMNRFAGRWTAWSADSWSSKCGSQPGIVRLAYYDGKGDVFMPPVGHKDLLLQCFNEAPFLPFGRSKQ